MMSFSLDWALVLFRRPHPFSQAKGTHPRPSLAPGAPNAKSPRRAPAFAATLLVSCLSLRLLAASTFLQSDLAWFAAPVVMKTDFLL